MSPPPRSSRVLPALQPQVPSGCLHGPPFLAATGSYLYQKSQAEAPPNSPHQSSIPKTCSSFGGKMGCISCTSYTRRSLGKDSGKHGLETPCQNDSHRGLCHWVLCDHGHLSRDSSPCRRQVASRTAWCLKCPTPPQHPSGSSLPAYGSSFPTDSPKASPKIGDH